MKWKDLNEAWRNVAINARGDLVSRWHIHSVGPTDRRERGSFPRKLEARRMPGDL